MSKKQKKMLLRILLGAVIFLTAIFVPLKGYYRLCLFIPAYLVLGGDVFYKAVRNILRGKFFDENFLMAVATIGAFFVGEYPEGVAVMLFYQIGEWFQSYAVDRSRKSIADLMDIRPDYANIEKDGSLVQLDPEEIAVGDIIVVKPGERIPIDGTVIEGSSMLDTAALTGEAVPRKANVGDDVISGCVNQNGLLRIKTTKEFGQSTVSKVLDLVENASNKKAKSENFITRFARYYTPCVVIAAVLLAVIPPLVLGQGFAQWIQRALIFLVISCPCALVISVPLSFFGGIGGAGKHGILIKGGNYLEALSKVKTIVFDKTGTLTKGVFEVKEILPEKIEKDELLKLAAFAENYSDHPVSLSIKNAYGKPIDAASIGKTQEIAGKGVKTEVCGTVIYAGNQKLMQMQGIILPQIQDTGTVVYVAKQDKYLGAIIISDQIKPDAKEAVAGLKANGIQKCVMLTGDLQKTALQVAKELDLDEAYAQLLPADKVEKVEQLLTIQKKGENLMFVGDGINDAPVLSRADVGVAMGGLGSDAAIEAADVVLMNDKPTDLVTAIKIARKTLAIVYQNIIFALAVKAVFLVLGACGIANMWMAVFADVGVSVLAILNATRALYLKQK